MIVLDDTSALRGMYSDICSFCKHFKSVYKCAAFSDDIPIEIWTGQNDHTTPYPGDNGIQFEPIAEQEADNA